MKTLIGVGMGPGDPELVTVKAVRVLREADVVVVPVLGGVAEPGRAESIVRAYVDGDRVKRLEFALDDTGGVTARRAAAWRDAAAAVAAEFDGGARAIAFGTLGDPNLYSTFSYLAQTVRDLVPDVQVATVAGITAMQDLASRCGISLAEGTEPLTLLPLNASPEILDQALAHGGAVVGYKLGAKASTSPSALRARLAAHGRLGTAVIGARLGLPGEQIAPAATLLPEPAPSAAPPPSLAPPPTPSTTRTPAPPPSAATIAPPGDRAPALSPKSDIPYLSTLIVPAIRQPGTGSSLANHADAATTRLYARGCRIHAIGAGTRDTGGSADAGEVREWLADGEGRAGGIGHDRVVVATHRIGAGGCDIDPAGAGRAGGVGAGRAGGDGEGPGSVAFVGAGPGAADLLTLRGARAIGAADIVIWASSLVHPDVPRHAAAGAEIVDSAALPMEGVLPFYQRAAHDGLRVARVHSGDPSLWGAIQEQLEQCERLGLATEIVPGVSSFTAVAARIGRELTIPEVAQSVILTRLGGGKTPMPAREQVAEFARHGTTMALFLSAARSGQLQDELLAGGYPPDTPCVVAFQVTWPDELILHCALADLAGTIREHKLWKHTLVLVGPGLAADGSRSHLYHPGHFHGHRKADREARKELRGTRP